MPSYPTHANQNPVTPPEARTNRPADAMSGSSGLITRALLLRALMTAVALVLVLGSVVGVVLFAGSELAPQDALPHYVIGLCMAGVAAMLTVWLHGRFAAVSPPGADRDPALAGALAKSRLQSLLAAAFGVKLAVLVLGVLVLKQFPLGEGPTKFAQIATFALTFAGGALLCQLATAGVLATTLRRPVGPGSRA